MGGRVSDEVLRHLGQQDTILARLDERTKNMVEQFEVIDKRLDSHGIKIRDLEKARNVAAGVTAIAAAIAGYFKVSIGPNQP